MEGESFIPADDRLPEEELDRLYRQALETFEASELPETVAEMTSDGGDAETVDAPVAGSSTTTARQQPADGESSTDAPSQSIAHTPETMMAGAAEDERTARFDGDAAGPARLGDLAPASGHRTASAVTGTGVKTPALKPRQILEAALFVGEKPLTTKRLARLLHHQLDLQAIEQALADLNAQYERDGCPYEIRLVEGGWRMALKPAFESVRIRTYGKGPKEIRLSQDAMEVLAVVAYQQPVTSRDIEEAGKENPSPVLRQLLRRELIAVDRRSTEKREVRYVTTPRFLELFGLSRLEELPRPDELEFR